MQHLQYIIGCLATCDVNIPPKNGSCSGTAGAGCCQVDLPKGVRVYQGFFNSLYNTTAKWRNTPCNYVTVMERAAFSFSTTYLTSSVFYDRDDSRSPVVMEWGITQKTCEAAKIDKNVPYACVSNYSKCITNDAGYLCKCSRGFKGNPYIAGGCTGSTSAPLLFFYYPVVVLLFQVLTQRFLQSILVLFQTLMSARTRLLTLALEYAKIQWGVIIVHARREKV